MRLAKSIGVVSLTILLLFLINIKGNKNMGWNPLNWAITNAAQDYFANSGTLNPGSPTSVSNLSAPATTPQVLGASVEGAMYYDSASGTFKGVGGSEIPNAVGGQQTGYTAPKPAPVDPFAKYGGQGAYNNLVAGFQTGLNDINTTGGNKAGQLESKYNLDIADYVNSLRSSQSGIDNSRINNFANQQLGQRQVNQMVGEGIQSGGVMLANKNAGDSSATDAIARAYGQVGQNRMQGVNNQFEAGNRDVMAAQEQLNMTGAAQMNRMKEEAKMTAGDIVSSARNELSALKQQQLGADLPTSIEIEQEIQGIIQRTNQAVAQIDSQLTSQAGTVKSLDTNTAQSRAFSNNNAGQGPTNYQNYTTDVPTNMRGGASVPSSLPIFTYRGNRSEF